MQNYSGNTASSRRRSSYSSRNNNNRRSSFSSSRGRRGGGGGRSPKRGGGRKQPTFNPTQFINKNPVEVQVEPYTTQHNFSDWPLDPQIQKNIAFNKITVPSPIQDQIIPEILAGKDVIGLAQTGTGKTAAFLIPLIQKVLDKNNQQVLILTPTRELAIQIESELQKLSRGLGIKSVTCVGGVPIRPQIQALKRHNQFIIGTPGRILDLIERRQFNPTRTNSIVLDEADRMLDMGFISDMRSILSQAPADRHTLFFSATMTTAARTITKEFLRDPVTISIKKQDTTNSIAQDIVPYDQDSKLDTLLTMLHTSAYKRVIVFGAMKRGVENLSNQLQKNGIKAESIHGNKSHGQRQRALRNFKEGKVQVLVATDVAARGIHVDNVTHVINYDLPNTQEDYVHRIGRTGRGSESGQALTFVPSSGQSK